MRIHKGVDINHLLDSSFITACNYYSVCYLFLQVRSVEIISHANTFCNCYSVTRSYIHSVKLFFTLTPYLFGLQVQDFLVHFWQGMPTHMLPILSCQATVDLVVVCDFVLYRVSPFNFLLLVLSINLYFSAN